MNDQANKLNPVIGAIIVLLFIFFYFIELSPLESLEGGVYDLYMRYIGVEQHAPEKITFIDIDDKSLAELGPWPWPRHLIAEMIETLDRSGVRLIGMNIPFPEKEPRQGINELKAFRERYEVYPPARNDILLKNWVIENLDQIQERLDNDRKLVESIKENQKVILPVYERHGNREKDTMGGKDMALSKNFLAPVVIRPDVQQKLSIGQLSPPFSELAQNAMGLGFADLVAKDDTGGRLHPMIISYEDSLFPSFPLRLAIAHYGLEPKSVFATENKIILPGGSISLIDGKMLIGFSRNRKEYDRLSFSTVLRAQQTLPVLKGKIALIGFNHNGGRRFKTPVSPSLPESDLSAQLIDNIVNNNFISRPFYMRFIELLLLVLLGAFISVGLPQKSPLAGVTVTGCLILLLLIGSFILFSVMQIWFKPVYIAVCLAAVCLYNSIRFLSVSGQFGKEPYETSRMLGLSFQSQGLYDLAFEKFRKLPRNNETKDFIYNLGLEYEKKRMTSKALSAFELINKKGGYRDLDDRISRLQQADKSSTMGSYQGTQEASIVSDSDTGIRSKVDRYEILGELGRGSMGLVYQAQDPKINRLVAIKTIRFSDEFDEDVIQEIKERFFREAEIAGRLSHPSIVTIHDVGDDRELTYMAMEYLEGEDLDKYITRNNLLPFTRVLEVIGKVADALDFAHKAKVIHRDIKPANVMLLKNGQVKVTDFGIAKAISSSRTRTGVILGTPNYMSPEQIMGQKIDARSDIFSLGVLFFQLITGELPFHGENLSGLLYQITQVKHPSPKDYNPRIPKVCEQIIDKAMAKSPDNRFKKAGDMAKVVRLLSTKIEQLRKKRSVNQ